MHIWWINSVRAHNRIESNRLCCRHETATFYYFRKCTQNDFVYMKFSSNCKICFRPNKNCRLHRNLLKLGLCSLCTFELMPNKVFFWAVCVENLHVLLSELSMYVNLFLSISLEIMRLGCGGAFYLIVRRFWLMCHELCGRIQDAVCSWWYTHWMYSFHLDRF